MASTIDQQKLREKYREERDKRLRKDGVAQYISAEGVLQDFDKDPYTPRFERPARKETVDVAIVGTGYGAMLAAIRLKQQGINNMRLFDKAGDFGGTWYWNRYPNSQCDVESFCYMPLLEETGWKPTEKYAHGPELFAHAQAVGRKFDLYNSTLFQTEIKEIRWNETESCYTVKTDRNDEIKARFVIIASGLLARVKLPGVPGITSFKGDAFHTARWKYSITGGDPTGNLDKLKDKVVGIIGTGATAVQCIPPLAESAKHLYVFQRTPSSIDVRNNRPTDETWWQSLKPGWQRERMENFTSIIGGVLPAVDLVDDGWTSMFKIVIENMNKGTQEGIDIPALMQMADDIKMSEIRNRVDQIVKDKKTAEALKPWYGRWCKRPCFHDEYLESFNRPNVTLVDTNGKGIEKMDEGAIWANGQRFPVDVCIFSTGFEWGTAFTFSHRNGFECYGRNGVAMSDHWANGRTRTMQGMFTSNFPNFAVVQLAQAGVTINFPHALDEIVKHVAWTFAQVKSRGLKTIEPTEEAVKDWTDACVEMAKAKTEFLENCVSGYYNAESNAGSDVVIYNEAFGGGPLAYWDALSKWREEGSLKGMKCESLGEQQEARL